MTTMTTLLWKHTNRSSSSSSSSSYSSSPYGIGHDSSRRNGRSCVMTLCFYMAYFLVFLSNHGTTGRNVSFVYAQPSSSSQQQQQQQQQQRCGCVDCTSTILNSDARGETCNDRIDARMRSQSVNETEACEWVAQTYPLDCGPQCHPRKCGGQAPALCNCESCTEEVWNARANGFTCGQRILFNISFGEATACQSVAERYPDICGSCSSLHCPISSTPTPSPVVPMDDTTTIPTLPTIAITTPGATCGCYACDESILNKSVGEAKLTCGQRIESLRSRTGGRSFSEVEACYQVSEEFPNDCGPACHPEKCAAPSPTQNATELCPCEECDETVLNTIADGFSCGERIRFLQTQAGGWFSATESCNFVASEFSACRACGPKFCDATSGTPRRFSEIRWSALLWVAVCVPTLSFWAM